MANERSTTQKLETNRMLLDRQNKELKAKLAEIETNQRVKTKTAISNLESKIVNLEGQLESEAKYVFKVNQKFTNQKVFFIFFFSCFILCYY